MDLLGNLGYDPQFGARPMKRVLQNEVTNELSKHLLAGEFSAGDTIFIDADAKGLTFGENAASSEPEEMKAKPTPLEGKTNPKGNGADAKVTERQKQIEELKKAAEDVKDAVADLKKEGKGKGED